MSKKRSYFNGNSYAGCRVSVKLVRKGYGRYEPREIRSPDDVYGFMRDLAASDRERFYSLHLDNRNSIVGCEEVSCGSAESSLVHARELFKSAILSSSKYVIIVHNHPSGNPEPSDDDIRITKKLYDCGELLGIGLLDSIIIGRDSYYSFKEKGKL
jgi:DNA repair protein RadC